MKTYGLLGKNIGYSLSPYMHNEAFKKCNLDAEYKIFDVSEDGLDDFFSRLKESKISGCNVTIPYKEKALQFIDKCDELSNNIGAINTVVHRDSVLHGYNTDCQGFIEALQGKDAGDLHFKARGKNAFIFGAGGAAKACIWGLLILGIKKIAIVDIDKIKAEELASSLTTKGKSDCVITVVKDNSKFEDFISHADLLINATPCGMRKSDAPLFDYRYIYDRLYVFDLIYAKETPLVRAAKSCGAHVINGINTLLYQAAASFKIWTDLKAPLDVMKKALLERVNK